MEEIPVLPFNSRPRLEGRGTSSKLRDLPDSLLCSVLAQASEITGAFTHALVCRKWAQVSKEAQKKVIVREDASIAESDLLNELHDFPNLRELELKRESALRLTNRFFLGIGGTCPRLESIIIFADSSRMSNEFSTEGVQGMICSLPGLTSIVLRDPGGYGWDVPDSVSSLRSLKVLVLEPQWRDQPRVLRIPPSIRELSFCNSYRSHLAEEEGGLQGVRLLIAKVFNYRVIPEALWTACSLRSLNLRTFNCQHLSSGVSRLTALRQLQLHLGSVFDVPDCFSTMQSLTHLRLTSSYLLAVPDSLWSLTSLKHLYLNCEKLMSIDTRVGQLQRLTSLEVHSWWYSFDFPSSLCGHSALCKLHLFIPTAQPGFELHARALTDANIRLSTDTDLSRFLRGCPSLSSLRLYAPKDASSLLGDPGLAHSLQHLRVWQPQLGFPYSIGCYSNLETLEIVNCPAIDVLPSSIGECGKLTKLSVVKCFHLRKLPLQLGSLRNLQTLQIDCCPELRSLPRSFSQLSTLENLCLHFISKFRSIPNTLGALHQLCTLKVSLCEKLNRLPESVSQLALLTSLSVGDCPLVEELPASMSQLISLNVLEIIKLPALQFLPEGVEKITTLRSLTIQECKSLRELPWELDQLKNLRTVVIEDCHTLRHLPPSIGDLLHLKKLHLRNLPNLSAIPQQIGQLSSLRELLLQNLPSLTSLPDSMTRLTGLAELVIKDCDSLAWI